MCWEKKCTTRPRDIPRILTAPFRRRQWQLKVTGRHRKQCRPLADRMSGGGRRQAQSDERAMERRDEERVK